MTPKDIRSAKLNRALPSADSIPMTKQARGHRRIRDRPDPLTDLIAAHQGRAGLAGCLSAQQADNHPPKSLA